VTSYAFIDRFPTHQIVSSKDFQVIFVHLTYNSTLLLASCCCSFLLHVVANFICIFLVSRQLILVSTFPILQSFHGCKVRDCFICNHVSHIMFLYVYISFPYFIRKIYTCVIIITYYLRSQISIWCRYTTLLHILKESTLTQETTYVSTIYIPVQTLRS
jgi:hypothetical protein